MIDTNKNDYDTTSRSLHRNGAARPPEHYLERWRRRQGLGTQDASSPGSGGGRMERFRRATARAGVTPDRLIAAAEDGVLPPVIVAEFHYHQWHLGILRCVYCGVRLTSTTKTKDHVVPRAAGGERLGPDNLVPACQPCNGAKGARTLLQFLVGRRVRSQRS